VYPGRLLAVARNNPSRKTYWRTFLKPGGHPETRAKDQCPGGKARIQRDPKGLSYAGFMANVRDGLLEAPSLPRARRIPLT
jgi:hypothetical protein